MQFQLEPAKFQQRTPTKKWYEQTQAQAWLLSKNKLHLHEQSHLCSHVTSDQSESSIHSMASNTRTKLNTCRNTIIEMHTPIETRLASSITHLINRAVLKRDGRVGRDARLNLALSRIHRRESDWKRGRIQAKFSEVVVDVILYCFKKARRAACILRMWLLSFDEQ